MKSLKFIGVSMFCLFLSMTTFGQNTLKKESFKVSGMCTECENRIEKAALKNGASTADWNVKTKILTVSYSTKKTNVAAIQKGIAAVGHDTPNYKATSKAYQALPACCKYK